MSTEENNLADVSRMLVFEAVARTGGFTAAARELGLSKSAVSKHVGQLEASLGARLLHRTTRVVRPTEAGRLLYERCVALRQIAREAPRAVEALQSDPIGRLRVSVPVSFGRRFLEAPLVSFLARYPRVEATIELTDRRVDVLREEVDLAVRVGPVQDAELVVRRLATSRRLVVAAPSYLEAQGTPTRPDEVRDHTCLLYDYQTRRDHWRFELDGVKHDVRVHGRVRCNHGDLLAAAARAGLGLAWLPDFIVRDDLESGALVAVLDAQCRETAVVNAVLPARDVPVKTRALLEHLAASFA